MLAPSFKISTWAATIPASSTPRSGIHARPRTTRSRSAWSGSASTSAPTRPLRLLAGFAAGAGFGTGLGRRAGAVRGAGSRPTNGRSGMATAAATTPAADPLARATIGIRAGRLAALAVLRARVVRAARCVRLAYSFPFTGPETRRGTRAGRDARRSAGASAAMRAVLGVRRRSAARAPATSLPAAALRAAWVSAPGLIPRRAPACAPRAGALTSISDWPRSRPGSAQLHAASAVPLRDRGRTRISAAPAGTRSHGRARRGTA